MRSKEQELSNTCATMFHNFRIMNQMMSHLFKHGFTLAEILRLERTCAFRDAQGLGQECKGGIITGGHITSREYSLTGIENSNTMCPGAAVPAAVMISGICGNGVTAQFVASNGERATFSGSVICS